MEPSNVFGVPIIDHTKTRAENADCAQKNDKVGNKYDQAVAYVNNEKAGHGRGLATRCIFYNATGDILNIATNLDHSYDGKIWDSYPLAVKNGQWGAFLHVGNASPASGSKAYVVYRVKGNNNVDFCKTLIGWETPLTVLPDTDTPTHAFCEVYEDGHEFQNEEISEDIEKAGKETPSKTLNGISMTANIETSISPLLSVKFFLNNA